MSESSRMSSEKSPEEQLDNSPVGNPSSDIPPWVRAFAIEYVGNGNNHRKAAKAVGRLPSRGASLLRDPRVRAEISRIQEAKEREAIITRDMVEMLYLDLIPKLSGEEEVPLVSPAGEQFYARKFHSSELVSVLRDLSKSSGYVKEEETKSGQVNIQINIDSMRGVSVVDSDG